MAILTELPGVAVDVVTIAEMTVRYGSIVNVVGNRLREYFKDDIVDEPCTATRYIEAETNARFMVRLRVLPNAVFLGDALAFDVSADGLPVCLKFIAKEEVGQWGTQKAVHGQEDDNFVRQLKFAEVETSDKDNNATEADVERVEQLGTITVKICHVRRTRQPVPALPNVQGMPRFEEAGALLGKAPKGETLSHRVAAGEGRAIWMEDLDSCMIEAVGDPGDIVRYVGIFHFRYRSLAILQAMLLIPRTPAPPVTPVAAGMKNDDQDEEWKASLKDAPDDAVKEEEDAGVENTPAVTQEEREDSN